MLNQFFIELFGYLLGTKSVALYIAILFFSGLGSFVRLYSKSLERDPESVNTPKEFSGKFMILDNLRSFLAGIIVPFLIFRLTNISADIEITLLAAAVMGAAGTQLDIWAGIVEGFARKNIKG